MTNPYASFLGDRDAIEAIAATPARLAELAQKGGEPEPGKWTVREILCHLADCEIVFAYRLRQALSQQHHTIQPFDQDVWANRYAAYDQAAALAVFTAVRQWNLELVRSLGAPDFAKGLSHPERGDMVVGTVVETMAGHDLNHLLQLEAMRPAAPLPAA